MDKFKVTMRSAEREQTIVVRAESPGDAVAEASKFLGPLRGTEAWEVEEMPEAYAE